MNAERKFELYRELTLQKGWYDPFPWQFLPESRLSFRDLLTRWSEGSIASILPPSRSIYVHVPFCRDRRCAFCMYGSHVLKNTGDIVSYISRIHREMEEWSPLMPLDGYTNFYVGGGTPSVLSPQSLNSLLSPFSRFHFTDDHENTCEMSPATAQKEHLEVVRAHGFNRVSFGIQSLDPIVLSNVNRMIIPETQLSKLIHWSLDLGFEDINVDLMVGLPGQRPDSVVSDAMKLAAFGALSMTVYRYLPGGGASSDEKSRLFSIAADCFPKVVESLAEFGWRVTNGDKSTAYLCLSSPLRRTKDVRYQTRPDGFHARSLFGLGAWANGFQGTLQYRCISGAIGFDASEPRYSVQTFSEIDQKRLAICTMLYARGLQCDESYWRNAFGQSAEDTFPEELSELESLGILDRQRDSWRIMATSRENAAAAIKFFWDESKLSNLLSGKERVQ